MSHGAHDHAGSHHPLKRLLPAFCSDLDLPPRASTASLGTRSPHPPPPWLDPPRVLSPPAAASSSSRSLRNKAASAVVVVHFVFRGAPCVRRSAARRLALLKVPRATLYKSRRQTPFAVSMSTSHVSVCLSLFFQVSDSCDRDESSSEAFRSAPRSAVSLCTAVCVCFFYGCIQVFLPRVELSSGALRAGGAGACETTDEVPFVLPTGPPPPPPRHVVPHNRPRLQLQLVRSPRPRLQSLLSSSTPFSRAMLHFISLWIFWILGFFFSSRTRRAFILTHQHQRQHLSSRTPRALLLLFITSSSSSSSSSSPSSSSSRASTSPSPRRSAPAVGPPRVRQLPVHRLLTHGLLTNERTSSERSTAAQRTRRSDEFGPAQPLLRLLLPSLHYSLLSLLSRTQPSASATVCITSRCARARNLLLLHRLPMRVCPSPSTSNLRRQLLIVF
jgi:hypothetical protein